jgi:hypothetical protein
MACMLCTQKLTYENTKLIDKACGSCQRHLKQMRAGFRGVITESRPLKHIWDNTAGYMEWVGQLEQTDADTVNVKKNGEYVTQRCDVRDMKRIVGLPQFLPLELQVYTAWIVEGVKDEKIQEVLGLTYSQLFHVKNVIQKRLQKQMAEFHQVKKLEKEAHHNGY